MLPLKSNKKHEKQTNLQKTARIREIIKQYKAYIFHTLGWDRDPQKSHEQCVFYWCLFSPIFVLSPLLRGKWQSSFQRSSTCILCVYDTVCPFFLAEFLPDVALPQRSAIFLSSLSSIFSLARDAVFLSKENVILEKRAAAFLERSNIFSHSALCPQDAAFLSERKDAPIFQNAALCFLMCSLRNNFLSWNTHELYVFFSTCAVLLRRTSWSVSKMPHRSKRCTIFSKDNEACRFPVKKHAVPTSRISLHSSEIGICFFKKNPYKKTLFQFAQYSCNVFHWTDSVCLTWKYMKYIDLFTGAVFSLRDCLPLRKCSLGVKKECSFKRMSLSWQQQSWFSNVHYAWFLAKVQHLLCSILLRQDTVLWRDCICSYLFYSSTYAVFFLQVSSSIPWKESIPWVKRSLYWRS